MGSARAPVIGECLAVGLEDGSRVDIGSQRPHLDAGNRAGRRRLAVEVDPHEPEAAHLAVAAGRHEAARLRHADERVRVEHDASVLFYQLEHAAGASLTLGHDRRSDAAAMARERDDPEDGHLGVRRVDADTEVAAQLSIGPLDDGDIPFAVYGRRRPVPLQPRRRVDPGADERLALLVRECGDRSRVLVPGRPEAISGRQRHGPRQPSPASSRA